jgi:hypothetical protein
VPGHRDDLDKMLSEPPNRAIDTSSGAVLLQHVEGASWTFLSVVRYDSWEKFAENEKKQHRRNEEESGGWFDLRNHVATHHDTLTDRILP